MSRKAEIIGDASIYTTASILTQAITLITGILSRKYLGPVQMGVWSLLQIIIVYGAYSSLGVTEAISREIPYHRGKGDEAKAEEIKNIIFSFSMFTSLLVAVGCIAYAFLNQEQLGREVFIGLLFVAGIILLQRLNNLYIAFLRGYKYFRIAATQMIYSSIVNGVLVAVLTYQFEVYGFMTAMCLSLIFNILYIHAHHPFHFRWAFTLKGIWGLIQFGFPLIIIGLLATLFVTIDKIMIAKILGVRELGIYSVALMAYLFLHTLPNSIGVVLIPNFHQKFGETEKPEGLRQYLVMSSKVFADLMPILIASGLFLFPYITLKILPEFTESIEPLKFILPGVFFLALNHPFSYFIVVIRKQLTLIPIILGACVIAVLCNYLFLTKGFGLKGVGLTTGIVAFVNFTLTYFVSTKKIFSWAESLRLYAALVAKFVYMVAVFLILNYVIKDAQFSAVKSLSQFLLFVVLYIPFLYQLNKELGVLEILKQKFIRKTTPQEAVIEG
jgi:O-antigen/teichoic acid export membrane protein